jgi:hypothetical protein
MYILCTLVLARQNLLALCGQKRVSKVVYSLEVWDLKNKILPNQAEEALLGLISSS